MEELKPHAVLPRTLFLSVLCLFSFVYFLLIFFLFLIALFYSGWISEVVITYLPSEGFTKIQIILLLLAGLLLHGTAFTGTVFLWKLKKMGYFLLALPCFIMAVFQLIQPRIGVAFTGVYILVIILFGLFYRRLR